MSALLGSLFGGLVRLAPEGMKLWDAKNVRAHELAMFDKQIAADAARAAQAERAAEITAHSAEVAGELQALIAATNAQGQQTGIGWVDALSSLMRPVLTFWWAIVLATVAMCAEFYLYFVMLKQSAPEAFLNIWGPDEKAIVASIIGFWFVDRAIRRQGK